MTEHADRLVDQLSPAPNPACIDCPAPAVTKMFGKPYCIEHASALVRGPDDVPGQIEMVGSPADLDAELAKLQRETERVTALRHEAAVRAVDRVLAAARNAAEADVVLDRAVRDARATGCTWQQIADAAGMTRQSAWRRWAPEASR